MGAGRDPDLLDGRPHDERVPDGDRVDATMRTGEVSRRSGSSRTRGDEGAASGTQTDVLDVYVPVTAGDTLATDAEGSAPARSWCRGHARPHHRLGGRGGRRGPHGRHRRRRRPGAAVGAAVPDGAHDVAPAAGDRAGERLPALLDSLTGLPNRRMLADRMRRTIAEAQQDGTRVGLMMLDIDHFGDDQRLARPRPRRRFRWSRSRSGCAALLAGTTSSPGWAATSSRPGCRGWSVENAERLARVRAVRDAAPPATSRCTSRRRSASRACRTTRATRRRSCGRRTS